MLRQHPAVDLQGTFMFFRNPKVAQKSIAWGRLYKDKKIILYPKNAKNAIQYRKWASGKTMEDINSMFKFCFVRNPWDRAVSSYFYIRDRCQTGSHHVNYFMPSSTYVKIITEDTSFSEFICNIFHKYGVSINPHFKYQYEEAFYKEKQFVDFIGRFENLEKDWAYVASVINANPVLPHINATPHKHYTEYYDEESKQIVAEIYKKDIELFNYTFDGENK
jgi:hypothetical protein